MSRSATDGARGPFAPAIGILEASQHVLTVVLVAVCLIRSITAGAPPLAEAVGVLAYSSWYLSGAALARRRATPRAARWWFAGLVAWWLVLVVISAENVWLAFPLWLLAGHLLRLWQAVVVSAALLVVVIVAPYAGTRHLATAAVVGPAVGAVFALVMSWGQTRLVEAGLERHRLVSSLMAAQQERDALFDDLARTQRDVGAAAERTRLSRDIHDTLAQSFSSIVLLSRAAAASDDERHVRGLLAQIESGAVEGLDESRRVVSALTPADLADSGLAGALQRLTDRFAAETGIAATLTVEALPALSSAHEIALLRAAQGALANVRGHAAASSVALTVAADDGMVRLDVVDDGQGFDSSGWADRTPGADSGYGLLATRARLREVGGGLAVESEPGDGTVVSAWVPGGRA